MSIRTLLLCVAICGFAFAQSKDYKGPTPPKADIPYLLHASNLIETEATVANEEKKKNDNVAWVSGASSPAKTPIAEPIFLIRVEKINPERLELYKMDVKNGRREIIFPEKRGKGPKPYPLSVRKVGNGIWRVEADTTLEPGQYSLSPQGANSVFLFEVY
jgi:hypothetical protein